MRSVLFSAAKGRHVAQEATSCAIETLLAFPRTDRLATFCISSLVGSLCQGEVFIFGRDARQVPIVLEEDEVRVPNTQRGFRHSLSIRHGGSLRTTAVGRTGIVASLAALALVATACGSSSTPASSPSSSAPASAAAASAPAASAPASAGAAAGSAAPSAAGSGAAASGNAATATSAAALGGMSGLVAAANKEGKLNVIALPPDWSNYGEVIAAFQAKYPGIKVNSEQPDISSAAEIAAAKTAKGTDQAPDVFDIGSAVALANTAVFAPYQVAAWNDIPAANKEKTGLWFNDYTGVMAVGYNQDVTGPLTSLKDLTNPKLKGLVALNGDPTAANSPLQAVEMASLANGGSLNDISYGVTYFGTLHQAGTFSSAKASANLITAGTIGVVFDWSYNQLGYAAAGKKAGLTWKTFTPPGVNLTSYYNQAINKDAPHPAAARLWEEYLYTAQAQNLWMKGGALPILYASMKSAGTLNADDAKNLPVITGQIQQMTSNQNTQANTYLAAHWAKAVS
jgi:putative spermidine/putrescine transport system substrate-binding protein